MKNTWRHYLRTVAATCAVSGSAWASAMCYAVTLAQDTASDPVYDDGWQEGDNGGFGFGPWNFDGISYNASDYGTTTVMKIDDGLKTGAQGSSVHNDIGRSWVLFNPSGPNVGAPNGATDTDIAQPGRSFPDLQVGQTLRVLIDNPIERPFFRGFTIKLNSGPDASSCFGGDNCSTPVYDPGSITTAFGLGTFEYFTYGKWYDPSPLYDTDTDLGVQIDFKLTSATEYEFTMTPLDPMVAAFTGTGTLPEDVAEIDWLELEFYNSDSDFYPVTIADPAATDFYVRSMEILSPDPAGVPGDYNGNGKVDAADYVLWRKHNGTNFQLANEVSGSTPGQVTIEDYNAWRTRFGNMSGGGARAGAVPEPGAFVLVVSAMAGAVALRWRRRNS